MYGLLAYEMMCGEPAFPMRGDEEELENRIKNCVFSFPDEDPQTHIALYGNRG